MQVNCVGIAFPHVLDSGSPALHGDQRRMQTHLFTVSKMLVGHNSGRPSPHGITRERGVWVLFPFEISPFLSVLVPTIVPRPKRRKLGWSERLGMYSWKNPKAFTVSLISQNQVHPRETGGHWHDLTSAPCHAVSMNDVSHTEAVVVILCPVQKWGGELTRDASPVRKAPLRTKMSHHFLRAMPTAQWFGVNWNPPFCEIIFKDQEKKWLGKMSNLTP